MLSKTPHLNFIPCFLSVKSWILGQAMVSIRSHILNEFTLNQ